MLISKNGRKSNRRKFLSLTKVVTNVVIYHSIEIKKKNKIYRRLDKINVVDIFGYNVEKCYVFVDEIINLLCTYLKMTYIPCPLLAFYGKLVFRFKSTTLRFSDIVRFRPCVNTRSFVLGWVEEGVLYINYHYPFWCTRTIGQKFGGAKLKSCGPHPFWVALLSFFVCQTEEVLTFSYTSLFPYSLL